MSSSYRSSRLSLSHWGPYTMHKGSCQELHYCNMVEWSWWDSGLTARPSGFLQCFDTVGLVIWPVKIVPDMTYNVFDHFFPNITATAEDICSRKAIKSFLVHQPCIEWSDFSLITKYICSELHNRRVVHLARLKVGLHSGIWIWWKCAYQRYRICLVRADTSLSEAPRRTWIFPQFSGDHF